MMMMMMMMMMIHSKRISIISRDNKCQPYILADRGEPTESNVNEDDASIVQISDTVLKRISHSHFEH